MKKPIRIECMHHLYTNCSCVKPAVNPNMVLERRRSEAVAEHFRNKGLAADVGKVIATVTEQWQKDFPEDK